MNGAPFPGKKIAGRGAGASPGRLSLRALLIVVLFAAALTVAFVFWVNIYQSFLETSAPIITLSDVPRGIGITPVTVIVDLNDDGAGLDEVVIRLRQRGSSRELLRRSLEGKIAERIPLSFAGEQSGLEEGPVSIEIRAFDRSFWNNAAEKTLDLRVDYRRPRIEVITSQHNAQRGGSQLVFYRAFDEELATSGVKVGAQMFEGYPARAIDRDIEDPNVYVAVYAVDRRFESPEPAPRLVAEDLVGNTASAPFYNKVLDNPDRPVRVSLNDESLRNQMAQVPEETIERLQQAGRLSGRDLQYHTPSGSPQRLVEKFRLVIGPLREISNDQLLAELKDKGYERLWKGAFERPPGAVMTACGDLVTYAFEDGESAKALQQGYSFSPAPHQKEVFAINDGIVIYSDSLSGYGRTVAVAHGLGVVSLYGWLGGVTVNRGAMLTKGQALGTTAPAGLPGKGAYYLELRVHGVPVDPREWWDPQWFEAHVNGKISEAKKVLGIASYEPLD